MNIYQLSDGGVLESQTVSDLMDVTSPEYLRVRFALDNLFRMQREENPVLIEELTLIVRGIEIQGGHPDDFLVSAHARGYSHVDLHRAIQEFVI
ncbi:hypothetical protein KJ652_00945 [Patescibacteria group bacterium]|nr:hypothetical protein [Patescibacteria group bacterium]MBU1123137.1 hypothetical protein [Patescibacteria group bacterium]MBU1911224.1 hypothetical protein [Patescibacteria group bacterium]